MPLYPRRFEDHYPDQRPAHAEHHVVLCGGLEVGGFHRLASSPSEGQWRWGASITASADFNAGGFAKSPEACRANIGKSFRAMLARADLRERADAKSGPPHRAPPEASIEPFAPSRGYDDDADRRLGPMLRNERRIGVRSGEVICGVLDRSTRGPEVWSWFLTGLHRPDDPDLVWFGHAGSEHEAFTAFEQCWAEWLDWSGLEQVGELQRGVKPR